MAYNFYLIDDHETILEGYKSLLQLYAEKITIDFYKFTDLGKAYLSLKNKNNEFPPDVLLVDYRMPAYPEADIENGVDLAQVAKQEHPKVKVVLLTSHEDYLLLYDMYKQVALDGFIVKSDIIGKEFGDLLEALFNNEVYHSATIEEAIKNVNKYDCLTNFRNRQIIRLISEGFQSMSISEKLDVSLSTVKKRKKNLRFQLGLTENNNDEAIILKLRNEGFL